MPSISAYGSRKAACFCSLGTLNSGTSLSSFSSVMDISSFVFPCCFAILSLKNFGTLLLFSAEEKPVLSISSPARSSLSIISFDFTSSSMMITSLQGRRRFMPSGNQFLRFRDDSSLPQQLPAHRSGSSADHFL